MIAIARPLLFASIDQAVAAPARVPVRLLGFGFLGLVGVTAAEATQAVGALLLLGLLAAPAGAAQRLTARPFAACGCRRRSPSASVWTGLPIAYSAPQTPAQLRHPGRRHPDLPNRLRPNPGSTLSPRHLRHGAASADSVVPAAGQPGMITWSFRKAPG